MLLHSGCVKRHVGTAGAGAPDNLSIASGLPGYADVPRGPALRLPKSKIL